MTIKSLKAFLALAILILTITPFAAFGEEPPAPAPVPAPEPAAPPPPPANCRISGMVYCTEYGIPYNDNPYIILEATGFASVPIDAGNGRFNIEVQSGMEYTVKIRYCSRFLTVGKLTVPACTEPCNMTLDIHYPGSMLEMAHWAQSGHNTEGITYQLKPAPAPAKQP